jgi:arsenite/tail-anchored protein-transporting ATPase
VHKLAFFVGKGGVGKTTVATAYAITTAAEDSANRVLLVSTDPAHSLADVLEQELAATPKAVQFKGRGKLSAWELDPAVLFSQFLRRYRQDLLRILEQGSLFNAREIAPLLDSALPGMAEIAALLAIRDAIDSNHYSHVVVDTAPFGHTLRLFSLPEQFARVLKFLALAAGRDRILAEHFRGAAAKPPPLVQDWTDRIERLSEAFSAADLFLVTTAEKFALHESVRCIDDLRRTNSDLRLKAVILNRVVVHPGSCKLCRKKAVAARRAATFLRRHFPSARLPIGEDPGFPILGTDALGKFGAHVFARKRLGLKPRRPKPAGQPESKLSPARWPVLAAHLGLVLGKGGVGKTTVSAALGFESRRNSKAPVEICSVDPAPSLDDIFQAEIGDRPTPVLGDTQLRASEFDSVRLFRHWVSGIQNEVELATSSEHSGVHIDLSFERELLSALLDIVPPGLDEVLAVFRISDLGATASGKIIVDMAPTGHALELLRMPQRIVSWSRLLLKSLAAHRKLALAQNAAVRIAELEVRARELANALKDSSQVTIFAVMLPEPLPDRETERLLKELERLELRPQALFVNRLILAKDAAQCPRCRIARQWQAAVLTKLKKSASATKIFVIRNFADEIAGARKLREFTDELWLLG